MVWDGKGSGMPELKTSPSSAETLIIYIGWQGGSYG